MHCLRNQHEISLNLGMGDSDRTSCLDLLLKRKSTLPLLPSTLPKRTLRKRVRLCLAISWTMSSATRTVAPITLEGSTALLVEIWTNCQPHICLYL